jgi:GNAT superfamily N-acetyltransferase
MKVLINESQIKKILNEYVQQADKLYFSNGKLSNDVKEKIKYIAGDVPYFRVLVDLFYHFGKFSSKENYDIVEDLNNLIKNYNKKLFPLKYNILEYSQETNESGKHVLDLYGILEERKKLIDQFSKLPSIGQRNLEYIKQTIGNHEYTFKMITEKIKLLNRYVNTIPNNEKGNKILNKIFNNKNDLIRSLDIAESYSSSFNENDEISMEELLSKLEDFDVEILQNSGNIILFRVDDQDTLIHLTCNSLWCFSRPHSEEYWNQYASDGFVYVFFNFDFEPYESEFMCVILPDVLEVYNSANFPVSDDPISYLDDVGVDYDTILHTDLKEGKYLDFNDVVDDDTSLEVYDTGDYLILQTIIVPKENRKMGYGTEIMEKLLKYSDKVKKDIYLTPDTGYGATSFNRLVKFYKRFGFVKNNDYSISEFMVRKNNG